MHLFSLAFQFFPCHCKEIYRRGMTLQRLVLPGCIDSPVPWWGHWCIGNPWTIRWWTKYREKPKIPADMQLKILPCKYINFCFQTVTLFCILLERWTPLMQVSSWAETTNIANAKHSYSISQEVCPRFLPCCALLWLYIDWFSDIHQAYFTGTVAI